MFFHGRDVVGTPATESREKDAGRDGSGGLSRVSLNHTHPEKKNTNKMSNDPRFGCKHINPVKTTLPLDVPSVYTEIPSGAAKTCGVCDMPEDDENDMFICLTCGNIGCGRAVNAHGIAHYQATGHPVVLGNKNGGRCYECEVNIEMADMDATILDPIFARYPGFLDAGVAAPQIPPSKVEHKITILDGTGVYLEAGPFSDSDSTDEMVIIGTVRVDRDHRKLRAEVTWNDQGWGNQKGRIGIMGLADSLFPTIAPHETGTASVVLDWGEPVTGDGCIHRRGGDRPNTFTFFYVVGEGGGHQLGIHRFEAFFQLTESDEGPFAGRDRSTDRTCRNGHTLNPYTSNSWGCDECGKNGYGGTAMSCRDCNYDCCQACFSKGAAPSSVFGVTPMQSRGVDLAPPPPPKVLSPEEQEIENLKQKRAAITAKIARRKAEKAREAMRAAEKRELSPAELAGVRSMFDKFDADKSGFIDMAELRLCVAQLGCKVSDEELHVMMQQLDVDKDGQVSFQEFAVWWSSDKKLGGNSGLALGAMRARMVGALVLSEMESRRVIPFESLSEVVNEVNVTVRTAAAFEPKMSVGMSVVPLTRSVFTSTMEEWTKGYTFASEKNERDVAMTGAACVTLVLTDDTTEEAARQFIAQIEELYTNNAGSTQKREMQMKLVLDGREVKAYAFAYMRTPIEQIIQQIARAYKTDAENFDTTFLFDQFSLSFETSFDAVAAAGLPSDLTAKFGNIFDNFAFTERASVRKDVVEYLIIETLHKGFETLFSPGPEMGMLFSAFMSSNVSGTVTVGGLEDSITHIALRIADRYRYRFNNAWERAEKEHPEDAARRAEPTAVELKKFILEGNARFLF